jgi:hypothetical protein
MGTVSVGAQLNITCSFTPNAPITLTFNGASAGQKTADSAGNAVFRITIFAIDRIDVDDIVPGVCGRNVLTGTGQGAGGMSSADLLFNLDCGASSLAGSSASGANLVRGGTIVLPSGQVPLGLISATGPAPGAVLPAPAGATTGNAPASTRNGRSSTAFTGANVVRLTLIGLVCIALGWQLTRLRRRGILS